MTHSSFPLRAPFPFFSFLPTCLIEVEGVGALWQVVKQAASLQVRPRQLTFSTEEKSPLMLGNLIGIDSTARRQGVLGVEGGGLGITGVLVRKGKLGGVYTVGGGRSGGSNK